jgi:hypothetical protein
MLQILTIAGGQLVFVVLIALLTLFPIFASGQQQGTNIELISKRYSNEYFPIVEGYVEYEIKLTNTDDIVLENRFLQVSLLSKNNKTHVFAEYAVPPLEPRESRSFHLGPFKLLEEAEHRLYISIKSEGSLATETEPNYQYDSFTVYQQDAILAFFIAIPLLVAGTGISSYSFYRRNRRKHVRK